MAGGRLNGTIWPIWPTGVAHFGGEFAGLMAVLWLCRLVSLVMPSWYVPAIIVLVLTHTRTALTAMLVGLLVAGVSLLLAKRRVRKIFVAVLSLWW